MSLTMHPNCQLFKTKEFTKLLGLIIDRKLTYKNHLDNTSLEGEKI